MTAGDLPQDADAWLDDVRRWFYGGTPPPDTLPAPEAAHRVDVGPGLQQDAAPAAAGQRTGAGHSKYPNA